MTNKERLEKLKQAESIIREVEFSYPSGSQKRQAFYRIVFFTFSTLGTHGGVYEVLKSNLKEVKG